MGKVKLEDVTELSMDTSSTPFDSNADFIVTLSLPSHLLPMHLSIWDNTSFNILILNKLS